MAQELHYLILDPNVGWLPGNQWRKILGATVKNPLNPTNNYTPEEALAHNKSPLIEDMYKDFILGQGEAHGRDNGVEVKGLGKLRWAKKVGENFRLEGKVVYIKRLRHHDRFWKSVNQNASDFKPTVATWVNERDSWRRRQNIVCLVVGLLMCEDVLVATTDEEVKQHEVRGDIPLGTIAQIAATAHGIPLSLDGVGNVSAGTSKSEEHRKYFAANREGKRIFALQLRVITTRKGELTLTYAEPDAPSNRRLGEADEEEDDPIPKDPTEDEWLALLQRQGSDSFQA